MSVQFYGYNFGGTSVFHISAFMHSLKTLVSEFGDFETLCVRRDSHRESTTCKSVCDMNRGIHCQSGSSFMGLAVNAGLSISHTRC